ncbi:MAG: efflux RND transporter periplasmic adaptor subunit [Blastochloris sp.]|nr:efflux RND transporter periplasmic adaptor subunit [Blastochloris sp.]
MYKAILIATLTLALVIGGLGYYKYSQIQAAIAQNANFALPPTAVTSIKAEILPWEQTLEATASFSPVQGVTVSAEEAGKVVAIRFESGEKAKASDVLVQLDVNVEEANLKVAAAKAELALTNLNRIQKLKGTGALADREIDDAESQVQQSSAEVESIKAIIDRKTIRAPFSGSLGLRRVQLGQFLNPGDPIVTLQTLDPIYVDFALPQAALGALRTGQAVSVRVDAFPGQDFTGKITAINPIIDTASRTVQVQATLPNTSETLRTGMYGVARITVAEPQNYVTIPNTCVNRAPYGDSVYIIETMKNPQGQEFLGVRQAVVKLGPTRGDQIAILEGLKPGEEVASSGLFKLSPSAPVVINNEITPPNQAQPKPPNT